MTIISDNENVRETVIGKSSDDIKAKIASIPNILEVQKVCMDMCPSFAKAVRDIIPYAEIVLDRFHIKKLLTEKLWNFNKKSFKKLDKEARKPFKEIRYLLGKNPKQLSKPEKILLKEYFKLNEEMKYGYLKLQDFMKILFNYRGFKHSFVSEKLTEWIEGARKYFGNFFESLETWWNEVVNACIYRENNARQEGINNKIKMIKRRAFGYRNWLNFEFRIYGECNP